MQARPVLRNARGLRLKLGLGLLALALSACQTQSEPMDQAEEALGISLEQIEAELDDALLAHQIRTLLAGDRQLGPLAIEVAAADGIVTLAGRADSPGARARAARLAQTVTGVRAVDNRLALEARS